MPDSSPAPAWYPDPENSAQLRWWNGTTWTADTTPVPAGSVPPPAPGAARGASRRRPWWVTALVVLGVIMLGGVLARITPALWLLVILAVLGLAVYVFIRGGAPRLSLRSRASGLLALGAAALLLIGGGAANGATRPAMVTADVTSSATPRSFVAAAPTPTPVPTTYEMVDVVTVIPFERSTVDDPERDLGVMEVVTAGVEGSKVTTYRVTKIDGKEIGRTVAKETVTLPPVTEVTAHGTREQQAAPPAPLVAQEPAGQCDPNYADACVPIASDVDCAGGSGNGPAYVQGPVRVVGTDIYRLDSNGDGIGCE
ncbi:G5 domain-containing protein [uncultured Microbacterium sp.]|uniref:G5 domain-containing protein n=1 Tax=uncultured Microbacterium sp. TaxID=191216 RepID=UPI0025DE20E6|nr:G5 domain-containing protein [uncultured Microbacterium sp.]